MFQTPSFKRKDVGFTLAEILMISGIVALIGSIILILSKGAIEKARIAKVLQFDANINHALGAYVLGIWNFDEGTMETCPTGEDICDSSGNKNHCIIQGNPQWTSGGETPSKQGRALIFDGQDDYLDCGNDSSLDFIASGNYTYTGWFKSNNISLNQIILDQKCYDDSRGLSINIFQERLQVYNALSCDFVASSSPLNSNNWYHFAVSYSNGNIQIYINGNFDGSGNSGFNNSLAEFGVRFVLGGYHPFEGSCDGRCYSYAGNIFKFNGLIDNPRIYSEALTSAQVKKLYVEGAKERGLLTKE